MNVVMSLMDYNLAGLEEREKFSFTKSVLAKIYDKIKDKEDILGATIISTCNRTEIYLSLKDTCLNINPFKVLCEAIDIDYSLYKNLSETLHNEDVIKHLFMLSSGAKSMIFGEDQIITQVKDAISFARENKCSDSILEVIFRIAVSAGKKVKTTVDFKTDTSSTAMCAVNTINKYRQNNNMINKVLVIGNGVIGRLLADILVNHGFCTTMTLRQYKYTENIVPNQVDTLDYNERYNSIDDYDAVVSATLSPHHTIEYDMIKDKENLPQLFVDLAVPRDIDMKIKGIKGITLLNIDDISSDNSKLNQEKEEVLAQVNEIVDKYIKDFYKWLDYKNKTLISC